MAFLAHFEGIGLLESSQKYIYSYVSTKSFWIMIVQGMKVTYMGLTHFLPKNPNMGVFAHCAHRTRMK